MQPSPAGSDAPLVPPDDSPWFVSPDDARDPVEAIAEAVRAVIHSAEEIQDYLQRVVDALTVNIPDLAAVSATMLAAGHQTTVAASSEQALELDRLPYEVGVGPSIEAYRTQAEQLAIIRETAATWECLEDRADVSGIAAVLGMPLLTRAGCHGTINFYAKDEDSLLQPVFRRDLRTVGQRVADVVGAGIELLGAQAVSTQLKEAMASRATIEQAKGVIMALQTCDEVAAFGVLKTVSQRRNIKLREVAQLVVLAAGGGHTDLLKELGR